MIIWVNFQVKHTDTSRHVKSISKNKQSTIQRQIHVSIQNQQAEGKEVQMYMYGVPKFEFEL